MCSSRAESSELPDSNASSTLASSAVLLRLREAKSSMLTVGPEAHHGSNTCWWQDQDLCSTCWGLTWVDFQAVLVTTLDAVECIGILVVLVSIQSRVGHMVPASQAGQLACSLT